METPNRYKFIPEELLSVKYDVGEWVDFEMENNKERAIKSYLEKFNILDMRDLMKALNCILKRENTYFNWKTIVDSVSDDEKSKIVYIVRNNAGCNYVYPKRQTAQQYILAACLALSFKQYNVAADCCHHAVLLGEKLGYYIYLHVVCRYMLKKHGIRYEERSRYVGVDNEERDHKVQEIGKLAWNAGFVHSGLVFAAIDEAVSPALKIYRLIANRNYSTLCDWIYYIQSLDYDSIISAFCSLVEHDPNINIDTIDAEIELRSQSYDKWSLRRIFDICLPNCTRKTLLRLTMLPPLQRFLQPALSLVENLYKKRLDELEIIYKYAPNGDGYLEAKKSFEDKREML